jgi:hypothetical protein
VTKAFQCPLIGSQSARWKFERFTNPDFVEIMRRKRLIEMAYANLHQIISINPSLTEILPSWV